MNWEKLTKVKTKYNNVIKALQRTTPTKYNRILNYIHNLKENIEITNKRDLEIAQELRDISKKLVKKLEKYYYLNLALYLLIYFSFISYFLRDIILISEISILVSKVVGILGTTFFFIALYFSNKIIDLYYQDLNMVTSHLISIYTKYQKDKLDDPTSSQQNYYNAFIKFINERY